MFTQQLPISPVSALALWPPGGISKEEPREPKRGIKIFSFHGLFGSWQPIALLSASLKKRLFTQYGHYNSTLKSKKTVPLYQALHMCKASKVLCVYNRSMNSIAVYIELTATPKVPIFSTEPDVGISRTPHALLMYQVIHSCRYQHCSKL